MNRLQLLLDKLVPAPDEWFGGKTDAAPVPQVIIQPSDCSSYADLVKAWKDTSHEEGGTKGALHWSDSIDVTFSVMLATVASVGIPSAQIFLRVFGPPGSVKTTLCEAIAAAKQYVHSMSMQTGFHSGQEGNELFQFINDKTVIINEGDMLLTNPNKEQILSQMRDMWSGIVRAHYKNGVSYEIEGLKTNFIIAGTATLRKLNRSSAGDRFLDCVVHERKVKGAADIGEMALLNKIASMAVARFRAGITGTGEDPHRMLATRMTVGFVHYLRQSSLQKMESVEVPKEAIASCQNLAQLVGYMRARPDEKAEADETEVELASRLTEQFIKLAMSLAVVLGTSVNKEVMRRVAMVARDTCRGRTFTVCQALVGESLDARGVELKTGYKTDTTRLQLTILEGIGCIRKDGSRSASGAVGRNKGVYRLTPQMTGLMKKLYNLLGAVEKAGA